MVTRFTKVGGGGHCTFARASPVSLSRKPLSLDIEATPKTDLSLSGSLVHRQTWRLTGSWDLRIVYLLYVIWQMSKHDTHVNGEHAGEGSMPLR